jgi:hypothetical protein
MAYNDCRDYGNKVIGEVTLDQAYGGARGIKSLVWEVGHNLSSISSIAAKCFFP